MAIVVLGGSALLFGLLISGVIWKDHGNTDTCQEVELSKQRDDQLFQQVQAAKGTAQEEAFTKQYEKATERFLSLVEMCEADKLETRNGMSIFLSIAGVGLVLAISAILFGRKQEPEPTRFIT